MKKAISISLAVYFLFGSLTLRMDFQQLLHLACAVEHFAEHHSDALENGSSITILDFLKSHYLDSSKKLNNQEQESEGHQPHPCSHSHNHTVDFAKIDLPFPSLYIIEEELLTQKIRIIPSFYSSDFTSGLDQPPSFT